MRDLSYKYVVASGCSYTHNSHDFKSRSTYSDEHTTFIEQLGLLLGVPWYNLAKGGFSLHSIFQMALRWIEDNTEKLQDTFFVIGLTHYNRYNFFLEDKGIKDHSFKLEGINGRIPGYLHMPKRIKGFEYDKEPNILRHCRDFDVDIKDFEAFHKTLWDAHTNLDHMIQDEIRLIKALKDILDYKGIDYVFIDIPNEHLHAKVPNWRDHISPVLDFPNGCVGWKQYILTQDEGYQYEHPNYDDHVKLANILYQYICEER